MCDLFSGPEGDLQNFIENKILRPAARFNFMLEGVRGVSSPRAEGESSLQSSTRAPILPVGASMGVLGPKKGLAGGLTHIYIREGGSNGRLTGPEKAVCQGVWQGQAKMGWSRPVVSTPHDM